MKAKFSADIAGRVTLEYDDEHHWTGETVRVSRTFTCPENGGYVRERTPSGNWEQVCDGLSGRGSTLTCSGRDKLLGLIRAEYCAMRRAEKRAQQ
jgi:hypothetical protein